MWNFSPIFERSLGGGSYVLVVGLAVLLLAAWTVGVLFSSVSPRRKAVLGTLRFLALVVLVLVAIRPQRVHMLWQKQSATLVLLIDVSRSMNVEDMPQNMSRFDALRDVLEQSAGSLQSLGNEVEIKPYVFDGETRPVAFQDGRIELGEPIGDESAIGGAMRSVLRREDGKRLIAFVLASDGAQQTAAPTAELPETAAQQLVMSQCPLFTITFGSRQGAQQARDVAVETMPDDLVVFVKNQLTVTGSLKISGYRNLDIPVQLVVETSPGKEEVVATENYRAIDDGEQIRYELNYTPQAPGEYKIMVRATAQEGEVTLTNNELPTYVTVLAGGLRVLYLQGELRYEQRFLRRALAASPDIEVELVTVHTRDRSHWPKKGLAGYFEPGKFDVYILGDIDSDAFEHTAGDASQYPDLAKLRAAVEGGSGLLVLGGWHSFRPGGYHQTPLSDIMPVEMDAKFDEFVRQRFPRVGAAASEKLDKTLHLEGPLEMLPSKPFGVRHYMMRIAPTSDNFDAWQKLPALSGANKFRNIRPGAQVLAEDQNGRPLLVAGEPGGRVLAFAGDSTWRWAMHGKANAHRRFWRQAILWLAKKDEIAKGKVWVKLDRRRFTAGERIAFSAGARSDHGDPLPDAKITAQVVGPGGTRQDIRLVRQGSEMRGAIGVLDTPGNYRIEVAAQHNGAEVGNDSARFMIYTKDRELSGVTVDSTMMASIAEQTIEFGGRHLTPEEVPTLFAELAAKPKDLEEKVRTTITYWDRWWVFALLVGLFSAEWFLRKKWRLV
jgi:uncharacterized membrane protein